MNNVQKRAIRILAEVAVYERRDREKIAGFVAKLTDPEPLPLGGWDDTKLWQLFHKYRRQHQQCPCLQCLGEWQPKLNEWQGELFPEAEREEVVGSNTPS
jgi:hypothetical protein